jgi:elongation factor P
MSILNYNEIRERKIINHEGEPWEVVGSHVARKQQRKPVNQVKLKSLINGRVVEHTFQSSDVADEADLMLRKLTFLYKNPKDGELWFSNPENPRERFTLKADIVGPEIRFVKEKNTIDASVYTNDEGEERIVSIKYPIKVDLLVTEAPPAIKGDTATGGKKTVTLETGATVNTPLFINEGDLISINTDTGEYSERVEKK